MNEKQINAAIDKINKARAAKRNPLTRVKVSSPSMATGEAPTSRLVKRRKKTERAPKGVYANPSRSRVNWHIFDSAGNLLFHDLSYVTPLAALKRAFPGVHVYSHAVSGRHLFSYAIDKEPRHVFVTTDINFDLRRGNPGRVKVKYDAIAADQMRIMVYEKRGGKFNHIANFDVLSKAKEYAQAYADAHNVSVEIRGNFRASKK